jgi:hypothetical protein
LQLPGTICSRPACHLRSLTNGSWSEALAI